jgi:riboflavin kinase / FMN adenylyltransferase
MNVIHNTEGFLQAHSGCVATIGKFDGVHMGHQRIVQQLLDKAAEHQVPSVVIVIEPHPEEFFATNPRDCPPA